MFCIGCFLQSSHVLTAASYLAHTHSSLTFSEIENTHTAYSSNSEEKLIHLSVITLQTLSPLGWKVLYVWNLNGLKNFFKKKKKKRKITLDKSVMLSLILLEGYKSKKTIKAKCGRQ